MKFLVLVFAFVVLALNVCFASDGPRPVIWKPVTTNRVMVDGGTLKLTPQDAAWDRVAAIAPAPITFWTQSGATLKTHINFVAGKEAAGGKNDVVAFIGLTSNNKVDTYQSADNIIGLYLEFNARTRHIFASLAHKEKNGDTAASRGDEWGNLVTYQSSLVEIPTESASADITLSVTDSEVIATVAGSPFHQRFPLGLTASFWKRAYLLAQCMNNNEGRGALALDNSSIAAAASTATDADEIDYKRRPPDSNIIPDQITLRTPKQFGPDAFSVAGSSAVGGGGAPVLDLPIYGPFLKLFGGITRFPYGNEITFYFWPYEAKDWIAVLGKKGGGYGAIERWYYPNSYKEPEKTVSYQTMLAAYKRMGLKLILLFNTHAMFDGKDFVYVKKASEEKMKAGSPLGDGMFSRENLKLIVENNSTLVDYVIKNGYTDTVAYWEMDNERWDMQGKEYAECAAEHIKMLRKKLPGAKVIVGLAELGAYSKNADREHGIVWSRDVLTGLRDAGLSSAIDCFAPHLYPYLFDKSDEITGNLLEDWNVRNSYRSLDYLSAMLDANGFNRSKFYVSEWGTQSDGLEDKNELITSMASAVGTVKEMMAIYSHPRVVGTTWHQFFHASYVSKAAKMPFSRWGEQTVYLTDDNKSFTSPPAEAVKMFVAFARGASLITAKVVVPNGVHYLCSQTAGGKSYFVVNSTSKAVDFKAPGASKRLTLAGDSPTATSIIRYGGYGDTQGEINEIVPRSFESTVLPPYSVSMVR